MGSLRLKALSWSLYCAYENSAKSSMLTGCTLLLPFPFPSGAQYAAWHPDSRLLAVTSDGLHATFVFDAATRQKV